MIDALRGVTDASAGAAAMKKATGMNKDDFLNMFIAQVKNQDPLNPMDGTQFLAQLAQLTQVEQAYNTNSNLTNLLSAQGNAMALSAVSFIGKQVLAEGGNVALTSGQGATLSYRLPTAAAKVQVEIRDAAGAIVRTITAGKSVAGDGALNWDGRSTTGATLPSGIYTFNVKGFNEKGTAFAGISLQQGTVDGVRFDGQNPILMVGGTEIALSAVQKVKGVI